MTVFHPFLAAIATGIVLTAGVVSYVRPFRQSSKYARTVRPGFLAVGVAIGFVLLVQSSFANGLILAAAQAAGANVQAPSADGGPAGAGLIQAALFERIGEFLLRSSFLLALALTSGVAIYRQYSNRNITSDVAVAVVSGSAVFVGFLVIAFIPKGIGITRIFSLAPVFFVPIIPYALSHVGRPTWRQIASVGAAFLIVGAGGATAFDSPMTGGVEYSATESQVESIEWAVGHTSDQTIVGSRMTHWVIVGLYGREASSARSRIDGNGMWATRARGVESYRSTVEGLVAVDGPETAHAEIVARESSDRLLRCLQTFEQQQNQVYANGESGFFTHARPPSCAVGGVT
ncbi:hypothetical protein NDI76_15980 [Halogeometricum sp. S1BR25-6]|uniref:Uncharacterized protein n=1 Tax=Halogeometricum salsisoli TaxID=2950536 RepID=A0ABU2GIK9_9EURY|nr:hypothetical protein [Halogeometricum sp. S1BR25-6]MDS0300246.1 hypothetical protein [Halogeometricum sp. S1BR25-6]